MLRKVKAAAVQMDAAPAPTNERLKRAAALVAGAAEAGAKIVVLPELFSLGYEYSDANYAAAEPMTGEVVTWMKAQAAEHNVYLAGTLLLLDGVHVYNAALLIAPDGRTWRYDKQYPFAWERAYFREGTGTTVADTEYGRFGLMICWDAAHADVWRSYAGQVDAMLIMSSPPCVNNGELCFPDGTFQSVPSPDSHFADEDMEDQAAWMRVPVVHTGASGKFSTHLPLALISVGTLLRQIPSRWEKLLTAYDTTLEAGYSLQTRVIDGTGEVLARVTQDGDSFTVATLELPDTPPLPDAEQPPIHTTPETLLTVDLAAVHAMIPLYQRGLRRQHGGHMAPFDARTRVWMMAAGITFAAGWITGLSMRRNPKR